MEFDNPDAIIRIRMTLEDHAEQTKDEALSELGWSKDGHADIGWCVGVHVADALQRLLEDGDRLMDAYDALEDCIRGHRQQLEKNQPAKPA